MNKKVSVFIVSNRKNVLLLKTNSKLYNPSYWSIVNGSVEDKETFEEAAKRETLEETGLKIDRLIYSGFSSKYQYPKGNMREKKIFIGVVSNENVILSTEHEDFKWVPLTKLKEEFFWTESKEMLNIIIEKIKALFIKNESS